MLKNLMYVTVYVSDQDRALAFYTESLGLKKRVDYPGPDGRFLTVAPGDDSVEIILWPGNPGQGPAVGAAPHRAGSDISRVRRPDRRLQGAPVTWRQVQRARTNSLSLRRSPYGIRSGRQPDRAPSAE